MKYFGNGLSEIHKDLNSIIRKRDQLERAKSLFLELHAKLNLSEVSGTDKNEVDALLGDLQRNEYAIMPTKKDETIAWVLWHIARIEDLTMNMLVAGKEQIFNDEWKKRLNVMITDTGNALTDDEIMELSQNVHIAELLKYRNEVAKSTREIVQGLTSEDIRRKVAPADINRILETGGVTEQEDSIWLLDFWGKKDVAGILLMPPTRHVILHLNDCCKWKEHMRRNRK
ncbi:MAG: DinB family protein [Lachnospiraceae bacterium]|nr:DinB family protein [Lachnospiraceae bacterium]